MEDRPRMSGILKDQQKRLGWPATVLKLRAADKRLVLSVPGEESTLFVFNSLALKRWVGG